MTQPKRVPWWVSAVAVSTAVILVTPLFTETAVMDWPWYMRIPYWGVFGGVAGSIGRALWRINAGQVNR